MFTNCWTNSMTCRYFYLMAHYHHYQLISLHEQKIHDHIFRIMEITLEKRRKQISRDSQWITRPPTSRDWIDESREGGLIRCPHDISSECGWNASENETNAFGDARDRRTESIHCFEKREKEQEKEMRAGLLDGPLNPSSGGKSGKWRNVWHTKQARILQRRLKVGA